MRELVIFVCMNGAVGAGGALIVRYALGVRDRCAIWLGGSLVAWVYVVVGLESLGSFGLIRLGPALALAALGLAAGLGSWAWGRRAAGEAQPLRTDARDRAACEPGPSWRWTVSLPLGIAGALAAWGAMEMLITGLCSPVRVVSDAPIYHLYFAVQWWKAGTIVWAPTPFGETAAPYFPASADLWFTWLLLPWSSEQVAKVGQWPFLLLGMGAIAALARELPARGAIAAFSAILWGTASLPLLHSAIADVDLVMAAWFLVALWFIVRYGRGRASADLVLAALAMGAALGTKYVAIPFVAWLVPVAAAFAWRSDRPALHLAILAIGILVPCAYWYGRNLLLTGNPLYPLHVQIGDQVVFAGWYTRATMHTNEFYHVPVFPLARQSRILAQMLLRGLDPVLVPVWLAGVAAAAWDATRGRRLGLVLVGLALAHILTFWFVNPYQTQERFLFGALALLAVPIAALLTRWPWLAWPVSVLIAWHLVADQIDLRISSVPGPVPAPIRLQGLPGPVPNPIVVARLAMLGSLAAAVFVVGRFWSGHRAVSLAVALSVAACGVAYRTGFARIKDPALRFYPLWEGGFLPGWYRLEELTRGGARVAYAGTNLPYYLFGVGFRNEVRYVNVNAHADFLMHDYHTLWTSRGEALASSATPDWDRRERDEAAWLENLRAARIDFLFIGLTNRAGGAHNVHDREGFPIEQTWAAGNPAVFRQVYGDPFTRVYAVDFEPDSPAQ